MSRRSMSRVLMHIRHLAGRGGSSAGNDAAMLQRFIETQDEDAFTELLQRHGPMVFGVCRRLLADGKDAEDVFQATFLVLIQRARSIRRKESVGCWLHGVASRLARRVAADAARRRQMERQVFPMKDSNPFAAVEWKDLRPVLDEELCRLHEKYREPLLLCYVEGKSHQEAAQQLNWPITIVYSRLARARELLRSRLARRGLAPAVITGALALGQTELVAAVPPTLTAATVRLAVLVSAGKVAAMAGMAPSVATLLDATMKAIFISKMKIATATMAAVGILAVSAGVLAHQALNRQTLEDSKASPSDTPTEDPRASAKSMTPMLTLSAGDTPNVFQSHSVAFSPDGSRLAALGQHGVLWLWDATTGKELGSYRATFGPTSLSFSPDGRYIACCKDGGVTLWEVQIGRPRAFFSAKAIQASAVSNHPQGGHLILCAGNDIILWDLEKRRDLVTLRGHTAPVVCAIMTPKGNHVASAGKDGTVRLWDFVTGKETSVLQRDRQPVDLCFSPDGKYLAVADRKEGITVYDPNNLAQTLTLPGRTCVTYSPDGKAVAAVTPNATGGDDVAAWDGVSGKQLWVIRYGKPIAHVAFNADGERIATIRTDALVEVWDVAAASDPENDRPISVTARAGRSMARPVESLAAEEEWTGERRQPLHSLSIQAKPERRIRNNGVRFSPDGMRLAGTSRDGKIHVWDAVKGHELFQSPAQNEEVWGIAYRPDGKQLATVSANGIVKLCDADAGQFTQEIKERESSPSCVAYSPDGRNLAVGDFKGIIRIWDIASGKARQTLQAHTDQVTALAYTADGKQLVSTDIAGMLRVWNTETGTVVRAVKEPHPLGAVSLSRDGRFVASAADTGRAVIVRETATGRSVHHLPGEKCVAFSPDGRWVASAVGKGSNDVAKLNQGKMYEGEIRIWNLATGSLRLAIRDDADFTDVSFDPNGERLAAATNDGFVKLWDVADLNTVAEPIRPEWKTFVSLDSRFQILMPGSPRKRKVEVENGAPSGTVQHTANDGEATYTVNYSESNNTQPEQILDSVCDLAMKKFAGKVVTQKDLQLGHNPGREFHIDAGDGKLLRARAFVVGTRLYQVTVLGSKETVLSMRADRFLDSFQVIEK